jgi:DeoR/GlpR family transcriptional regulator of sugar metabolism
MAQFIQQQQQVSVHELCDAFSISLATARRDLDALAEQGKIKRVHGGAVALSRDGIPSGEPCPPPTLSRSAEQASEKARIGAAAAALVNEGETIFLSSGSTVLEVALHLRSARRLNVITNSLPVLNVLAGAPGINLVALGGVLNRGEMSLIGHITQQALSEVRADKVFIGIYGVDLQHGLTNTDLQETLTDRAILKIGREVILLADHTKCGRAAAAFVAPLSAIHTLITDAGAPAQFIAGVQALGIRTIVV